ncbi:carboxypeptidase-like regulatory domain-containing protein [Terrimonas pollutisoli]|uniref:carboxypeptidase-like regulatory domain-containing protein n=1 Tax=Terrimonas pollutisoli TaxID=3034147 RepID=UPI0023EB3B4A|nr:carboxypeptidase-like regulatory domain-containing protein [Terrimonas sp. H1YJ31]
MSKHIQLNIPSPCNENWDQMKPVNTGKFCGSCQKQVMDFTSMSDTQLVEFFRKQMTGSVCGRFMNAQLDRPIEIPKKRIPWVKYFFQFVLPAFFLSLKASAQGEVKETKNTTVIVPASQGEIVGLIVKEIDLPKFTEIRGVVTDGDGNGIPYASVFIKGTTIGAAADSTGSFNLVYPGFEKQVVLVSSCVGFESNETAIDMNQKTDSVYVVLTNESALVGDVVVVGNISTKGAVRYTGAVNVTTKCTFFLDTLLNKILPSPLSAKVYPNPVRSNNAITIDLRNQKKGDYQFQLYTMSGQLILTQQRRLDKYSGPTNIVIPGLPAGVYMLKVTSKDSDKEFTEKIVVQ